MSVPLTVTDLCLTLGANEILCHVNLEVPARNIVSIMGLSGSGKTSLLRCMAGLVRPTSGAIKIGDLEITEISEEGLNKHRARMGMVFQYSALFDSMNVYDNVAFGLRYNLHLPRAQVRSKVEAMLAAVGMEGTEKLFPAELSGGMRKRISLARALAPGPQVVFYDEPTSGLDPIVTTMMNELILSVRDSQGVTSVVVTHDVQSALSISDRTALLVDGRILAYDTPEQLRASEDAGVRQFLTGSSHGPILVSA